MNSLYRAKEITKKYSTFMNTENSKISDLHILSLNLFDKINWERPDKYVP